ncbi:MAG: hypothetical protein Fur0036_10810 [Fimbriimonadaceae bacterium]
MTDLGAIVFVRVLCQMLLGGLPAFRFGELDFPFEEVSVIEPRRHDLTGMSIYSHMKDWAPKFLNANALELVQSKDDAKPFFNGSPGRKFVIIEVSPIDALHHPCSAAFAKG